MRTALALALLGAVSAACGDGPRGAPPGGDVAGAAGPGSPWSGRFRGPDGAALTLADRGDEVDLAMGGESVRGRKATPARVEGEGEVAGGRLRFVLTLGPGGLTTRFTLLPSDGPAQDLPEAVYVAVPPDPPGLERDLRLVAHWRHTEARASGALSYVSDQHLVLEADGTLGTWDVMRSSAGSSDSARTGGTWKTAGGVLFVRADGAADWSSAGRYTLNDTHLLLDRDGAKTIYERL